MRQIQDEALLKQYIGKYGIDRIFTVKDLPFCLYRYERGEILNVHYGANEHLAFLAAGAVQIYAVRPDGSRSPVCTEDGFTLLGDMEFCGEESLAYLVEATRKVLCVELPLYTCRDILMNDPVFLRFLLHSVAHKMSLFMHSETSFAGLEEKLLSYMKNDCPDHLLHGVGTAAMHLRCSRRQLQRVLSSLVQQEVIAKEGKGIYRLL